MAFQTILGGFTIPRTPGSTGAMTLQNSVIDAANEKLAGIVRAPKTGTIDKVGFFTGTVTTGATVDVRLETVSLVNGDPTGTLLGTDSNGSQVIADDDDDTWFTTSLTTGVAVTKGDIIAAVIVNPSGSPGNMSIRSLISDRPDFPYISHFTAAWAKVPNNPGFSFEYSDGSYDVSPGVFPLNRSDQRTYNTTSSPDERGMRFKLPFGVRVTGAWVNADLDGNGDIVLYDSDGTTVLQTASLDTNLRAQTSFKTFFVHFAGTSDLLKDTFYRLILKPTTTTSLSLRDFRTNTDAIMDSMEGGQNFHYTDRTDAGSWSDSINNRPWMGLMCTGVEVGSVLGHANMQGGMQ